MGEGLEMKGKHKVNETFPPNVQCAWHGKQISGRCFISAVVCVAYIWDYLKKNENIFPFRKKII